MITSSSSPASNNYPQTPLPALAIWTVALAVFSLLTFGLAALPAVICGHLSVAETKKGNIDLFGRRVALAGLVIGYIGIGILGIWILTLSGFLFSH